MNLSNFRQDSDPKHTSRLCKGYSTKRESDGVLGHMTWRPQSPDPNPLEMVWDEMDRRVKAPSFNSFKTVGNPFQVTTSWSSRRECQDCAKQQSKQRVAALRNLKYETCLELYHTFLFTTELHMCSFMFWCLQWDSSYSNIRFEWFELIYLN